MVCVYGGKKWGGGADSMQADRGGKGRGESWVDKRVKTAMEIGKKIGESRFQLVVC